jgi:hypothetical protein
MMENAQPWDTIVFSGGGAKGTVMGGPIVATETLHIRPHIRRVVGASAGAGIAILYAAGVPGREIRDEVLIPLDLDGLTRDTAVEEAVNLASLFGLHDGERIRDVFRPFMLKYLGSETATLGDVKRKIGVDIYVVVTNLNENCTEIWSSETTPDVEALHAIRVSMAMPPVFSPWRDPTTDTLYADGGVRANTPIGEVPGTPLVFTMHEELFQARASTPTNILGYLRLVIGDAFDDIGVTDMGSTLGGVDVVEVPTGTISTTSFEVSLEERRTVSDQAEQATLFVLRGLLAKRKCWGVIAGYQHETTFMERMQPLLNLWYTKWR